MPLAGGGEIALEDGICQSLGIGGYDVGDDGDDTFSILTYVSTSLNRFDQVSFTVNRMHDERIHWIALIAIPFDQVHLHRRTELLREFEGRPSASITIRRGTPEDNLLERRLDDLLHDYRYGEERTT